MIEIPEMLNLIEIAVSERGANFRYEDYLNTYVEEELDVESCQYRARSGQPLCIAGVALNEAGLLASLRENDIVTNQTGLVGKVSRQALDVLYEAQNAQDEGNTWGYALEQARARAALLEAEADE
jgi:hypothetical protein